MGQAAGVIGAYAVQNNLQNASQMLEERTFKTCAIDSETLYTNIMNNQWYTIS